MSRNTDNEMKQIQQGLEAFLQQELQEMEADGNRQRPSEPQLYTLEEEEEPEKELDVIGSTASRNKTAGKRRQREDYYVEDWDSPERQRRAGEQAPFDRHKSGKEQDRYNRQRNGGSQNRSGKRGRPESRSASLERNHRTSKEQPNGRRGDPYRQESPRASRRKSSKKRGSGFKKLLFTAVLLIALVGGGLYYLVGKVYAGMNFERIDSLAGMPMEENGVTNILLIGNDSRENGEDGRSDAMILLSISSKTKTIYMTSLLRDMYVEIPGHDGNRLNAAYSFGGAELLMETIEKNLDIPVNRYVLVNFEAFAGLVDAAGGVDLELTTEELEYVNGYLVEYNMLTNRPQGTDNVDTSQAGMVHLNGPQALAYCRNRYIGTDFGRTERQRKVLAEVFKKLPKAVATNPQELFGSLMPNLTTNLTQTECFRLALQAEKLLTYDIISDNIPQPGTYTDATIRQMSVLEVDFDANIRYLKEKIYGETGN